MDRETIRRIETYRRNEAGPLENTLIDEFFAGEMDRSEFLQRGAMFGVSAGILGSVLAFAGEAGAAPVAQAQSAPAGKVGGTIRLGIPAFGASLEPYLLNEGGSLAFAGIPGEFLTFTDKNGKILPALATSWKPNNERDRVDVPDPQGRQVPQRPGTDGEGRRGEPQAVRDGQGLERGPLAPTSTRSGVSAKGSYTVVIRLKSPVGVFPYLLSQTTYQAIIQRASDAANPGSWVKNGMIGTGPFKLTNYADKKSATLVRNAGWWGGRPPLDGVKITFYQGTAPLVLALRAGQIDLCMQMSPQEGQVFKNDPKFTYYAIPVSAHRQVCMRTDVGPFERSSRPPGRRVRDRPAAGGPEDHARGRHRRQRQPVLERVRLERPVGQAARS